MYLQVRLTQVHGLCPPGCPCQGLDLWPCPLSQPSPVSPQGGANAAPWDVARPLWLCLSLKLISEGMYFGLDFKFLQHITEPISRP